MESIINSMLNDDLYKWSMCQAVCQLYPHAQAKYTFINRGDTKFPEGFEEALQEQIEMLEDLSLLKCEAEWLQKTCPFLTPVFIDFLTGYKYNPSEVSAQTTNEGELCLFINGPWYRTILWEVKLMAIISELYFKMTTNLSSDQITSALKKTVSKANKLSEHNIKYADFGTRRRFSAEHHDKIVHQHCLNAGNNFVGTSNMYLAMKYNIRPIGTQAHEWFMFHGAKYGYKEANRTSLRQWVNVYHGNLSIALSDTFTTDVFFKSFGSEYAKLFDGVRHDSGDPGQFIAKVVKHYKQLGIDPMSKTIVFSDGLSHYKAMAINQCCKSLGINCSFGIGTHLTNDIPGVEPLNMVIKMSACKPYGECLWLPVIKLSDTEGKHTGSEEEIYLCKKSLRI